MAFYGVMEMKLARVWFLCAAVILLLAMLCSCTAQTSGTAPPRNTPDFRKLPMGDWTGGDLLIEEQYDQIELRMGSDGVFDTDSEMISCYIVNHHVGYAFHAFRRAYLEKKEGDSWVYVRMRDDYDFDVSESWSLCGGIKAEMREYALNAYVDIRDTREGRLSPGDYRMVIGIAHDVYYAPFTVVESNRNGGQ